MRRSHFDAPAEKLDRVSEHLSRPHRHNNPSSLGEGEDGLLASEEFLAYLKSESPEGCILCSLED